MLARDGGASTSMPTASFDYEGIEGKASDASRPSFKEWVRAYIDARVDGIAITDHNSHMGIDQPAGR
jgi:hypothetical protein